MTKPLTNLLHYTFVFNYIRQAKITDGWNGRKNVRNYKRIDEEVDGWKLVVMVMAMVLSHESSS